MEEVGSNVIEIVGATVGLLLVATGVMAVLPQTNDVRLE